MAATWPTHLTLADYPPSVQAQILAKVEVFVRGASAEEKRFFNLNDMVFDPLQQLRDEQLRGFGLHEGQYVAWAKPWLERVGLGLMLWDGEFEGVRTTWLWWCDREGSLSPTGAERAAQAEVKAAKLAARLRSG